MRGTARLDDVVKVQRGHHAGMLGHVVEVYAEDAHLVRLGFTSNDYHHWYSVNQLTVMYRPGMMM